MDALIQAFHGDTLAKGSCRACAIGNIVAHAYGKKTSTNKHIECNGISIHMWNRLFYTDADSNKQIFHSGEVNEMVEALKLLEKTGYAPEELAQVEYAFETSTKLHHQTYTSHSKQEIMDDQYKGLCAVFDVLCEIEGLENSQEYKEMLVCDLN